ncbi:hypothetical protein B7486_30720 [cyanobacterium TDX16]|nr:hypothetical protein B7486_30720 [cyanobacterium TDX16]
MSRLPINWVSTYYQRDRVLHEQVRPFQDQQLQDQQLQDQLGKEMQHLEQGKQDMESLQDLQEP